MGQATTVVPTTPMSGSRTRSRTVAIPASRSQISGPRWNSRVSPLRLTSSGISQVSVRRQPSSARCVSGPCWRWIEMVRPSGAASSSLTRNSAWPGSGIGVMVARTGIEALYAATVRRMAPSRSFCSGVISRPPSYPTLSMASCRKARIQSLQ